MSRILVVDDDRDLADLLTFTLRRDNFDVLVAYDGPGAETALRDLEPDLVVLDLNLGERDGLELLPQLQLIKKVPVIILTARDRMDDVVRGLELGADDYLTKPFSHRELLARIRSILRRRGMSTAPQRTEHTVLRAGTITLNTVTHTALAGGQPVDLSVTEFRLLHYLMVNAGLPIPFEAILRQVGGYRGGQDWDLVSVALDGLRRKLEAGGVDRGTIQTLPDVGVLLRPVGSPHPCPP